jgi:CRISPR-associated protein Cmr2
MQYLFVCSVGPVQDFIFTARRSRDLWYGSWMLSELSKAAAKALADRYGLEQLIFPAPEPGKVDALATGSKLNVANKIVAIVTDAPITAGTLVQAAIDKRLQELRKDAFDHIRGGFDQALAERQLQDLVEYYWVSVTLNDAGAYADARRMADVLLDARKATRNFGQFDGLPVPKSSLDGTRESVILESIYPSRRDDGSARAVKTRNLYRWYGARRGERLSGVDLVKRQGQRGSAIEPRFKSTADVAAQPFVALVDRLKGAGKAQELLGEIKALLAEDDIHPEDRDGSLLYDSRLREWVPDEAKLDGLRDKLNQKLKQYAGDQQPDVYYALLMADGDNMGKVIDGQKTPSLHRQLSQALSAFALDTDRIINEDHQGVLIYAGGDDVLAYLPLHTALACAKALAANFADRLKSFKAGEGVLPTLSVGLVVVHHLDPLADALELAREAEKTAKSFPAKDALAITVSKRSGVDRTIVGDRTALCERLETMVALLRQDAIGKGAAYELQELHRVLGKSEGLPPEAVVQEALRIVKRKRESGGAKAIEKQTREQFEHWLRADKVPVGELGQEMIVAEVFAKAADLAHGRPTAQREVVTS